MIPKGKEVKKGSLLPPAGSNYAKVTKESLSTHLAHQKTEVSGAVGESSLKVQGGPGTPQSSPTGVQQHPRCGFDGGTSLGKRRKAHGGSTPSLSQPKAPILMTPRPRAPNLRVG